MSVLTPEPRSAGVNSMNPVTWQALAADWPDISRVLDDALAVLPAQRTAWLAARTDLADAVRSSLERLLAGGAALETDDFMRSLPPLVAEAGGPVDAALPRAGERVGPWRLLRLIGEGGMGLVFLAERADGQMAREVALKLPRLSWLPGLAERLARERDILAALTHPHIARLYDAGVDEAGRPWLALEYVDGLPLTDWCERHASSVAERLQLLLQVADAVSAAHARLVVHRDLKPANVLVTAEGRAMLLDFGIAGLLQADGAAGATLLGPRALTPDYASPEQVRGEPLGTASDVYSLGVVAYELLAGVRPCQPRRASASALHDVIERGDAPAASRACTDVSRQAALRGDLDAILAKALRKQPAERYASVDAFAQDLRRHLAHEPVLAQPDRLAYRATKFLRRQALPVAAATAVTVALAVGLGVALVQAEAARASAAQARASEQQAQKEAQRAGLVGNTLLNTFSRVAADPAFRTPDARERLGVALQNELDRLEVEVARVPSGVAEAHGVAASIFNFLQQPERQLRAARREQLLLVTAGEPPLRVAESHRQLALALARQGDSAAALEEALAGLRALTDEASPDQRLLRGRLHRAVGRYARQAGQMGLAYAHTAAAVQSLQGIDAQQLKPNIHHLGAALAEHAVNAAMVGRNDEALQWLAHVDSLYATPSKVLREADGADVELARCQVDLARGQPAAAAIACERALTLYTPQFGAVGRNADTVDAWRAQALVRAGALDAAAVVLQRLRESGTGAPVWLLSAEWALARGDLAQAEAWLQRQLGHDSHAQPPRRVEHHRLTAALRLAQGRPAEALRQAQAGVTLTQEAMPGAWRAERELREVLGQAEAALPR